MKLIAARTVDTAYNFFLTATSRLDSGLAVIIVYNKL